MQGLLWTTCSSSTYTDAERSQNGRRNSWEIPACYSKQKVDQSMYLKPAASKYNNLSNSSWDMLPKQRLILQCTELKPAESDNFQ